jgi:hypothetical protein
MRVLDNTGSRLLMNFMITPRANWSTSAFLMLIYGRLPRILLSQSPSFSPICSGNTKFDEEWLSQITIKANPL